MLHTGEEHFFTCTTRHNLLTNKADNFVYHGAAKPQMWGDVAPLGWPDSTPPKPELHAEPIQGKPVVDRRIALKRKKACM